jgi:hypothetical protein
MKVKLLKKIRKSYSIIYFPNGYHYISDNKTMILFNHDSDIIQYCIIDGDKVSKDKAYSVLREKLMEVILKKYKKYGTRRLKKNGDIEKIWYK